jgi:hypothetical protein
MKVQVCGLPSDQEPEPLEGLCFDAQFVCYPLNDVLEAAIPVDNRQEWGEELLK